MMPERPEEEDTKGKDQASPLRCGDYTPLQDAIEKWREENPAISSIAGGHTKRTESYGVDLGESGNWGRSSNHTCRKATTEDACSGKIGYDRHALDQEMNPFRKCWWGQPYYHQVCKWVSSQEAAAKEASAVLELVPVQGSPPDLTLDLPVVAAPSQQVLEISSRSRSAGGQQSIIE